MSTVPVTAVGHTDLLFKIKAEYARYIDEASKGNFIHPTLHGYMHAQTYNIMFVFCSKQFIHRVWYALLYLDV